MSLLLSIEEENIANSTMTFPQKLYILMEHEHGGDIVQWLRHGYSFRILDPDRFCSEIVPKYFKQTRLTSFQRQLNLYGFRRVTKGEDQGSYFHPKFQRMRKDLLSEIKRLPMKGSLPSLEQVMNSGHLPSERFGNSTNKNNESNHHTNDNTNSKLNGSQLSTSESTHEKKSSISSNDKKLNQNLLETNTKVNPSTSKVVPTVRPDTVQRENSNVFPSVTSMNPRTMSKLSQNIGFGKLIDDEKIRVNQVNPSAFTKPTNQLYGIRTFYDTQSPSNVASNVTSNSYNSAIPSIPSFNSSNTLYNYLPPPSQSRNTSINSNMSIGSIVGMNNVNKFLTNDIDRLDFLDIFNVPDMESLVAADNPSSSYDNSTIPSIEKDDQKEAVTSDSISKGGYPNYQTLHTIENDIFHFIGQRDETNENNQPQNNFLLTKDLPNILLIISEGDSCGMKCKDENSLEDEIHPFDINFNMIPVNINEYASVSPKHNNKSPDEMNYKIKDDHILTHNPTIIES